MGKAEEGNEWAGQGFAGHRLCGVDDGHDLTTWWRGWLTRHGVYDVRVVLINEYWGVASYGTMGLVFVAGLCRQWLGTDHPCFLS